MSKSKIKKISRSTIKIRSRIFTSRELRPMATDIQMKEGLSSLTEALVGTYTQCSRINHSLASRRPLRVSISTVIGLPSGPQAGSIGRSSTRTLMYSSCW